MSRQTFQFDPLDTLFFRESRPHGSAGGSELASLFPPPARTVAGAIRTAIGDAENADWHAYTAGSALARKIGYGDGLHPLQFRGPWLEQSGERLYPAPCFLLGKHEGNELKLVRLRIGPVAACDLGRVRLPELPADHAGYKPLEHHWLTATGYADILAGRLPSIRDIKKASDLYSEEPRLGIARNNAQATAIDGLLYQTRHIRPKDGLAITVDVDGAPALDTKRIVRFGAEGRMAALSTICANDQRPALKAPDPDSTGTDRHGLILTLLTPARFGEHEWWPPGFVCQPHDDADVWSGCIKDISLTIHAAVLGRAQREGGWDMAGHKPRPVQSLIPAGSAFYCTIDGSMSIKQAISALHDAQVGEDTAYGRGILACGLWNKIEISG